MPVVVEGGVVRDVLRLPASVPPATPDGAATPAELNFTQVARYHLEGATSARAVVLAMPGFLGGAVVFPGGKLDEEDGAPDWIGRSTPPDARTAALGA